MRQPVSPITLLVLTLALVGLGLVMVYSASGARAGWEQRLVVQSIDADVLDQYPHHSVAYLQRQTVWVVASLVWLMILVGIDTEWLHRGAPWIAGGVLLLLILVIATPLGITSKGATRWLRLGPVTIQPSEFAKPALVLLMARLLAAKRDKARHLLRGFLPLAGTTALFLGLILLERDLGTVVVLGAVVFGMWCLARLRPAHLLGVVACAIPMLLYALLAHSYRVQRILAFFEPEKYALTTGYQLNQSLIAVGSGGLFGRGLGLGLQKYMFLSESHTDFIFAIICEELGFIGAAGVVVLFLLWIIQGMRVSLRAVDYFTCLAAAGMTLVVGISAFVNFMVVLGLAPTKGLALPFISYGGSSMVATLTCAGVILNIANESLLNGGAREVLPVAA
jgi:cell division protein FtsW